jgi:hypothetical protein
MAEKRKSRDGHARKPAKDRPATFEPSNGETPPTSPREYDPKPIVERLDVWWLNGKDRYFQKRGEVLPVLSWSEKDVKRELRLAGVFSRASDGKAHSQADLVMAHIQRERHVDYAGPLAGKRIGVYEAQGRRILVTTSPRLIEPHTGDWPVLRAVLSGLLTTPEEDQMRWLFAWLKVGVEALRKGETRPGHGLIVAGPSNCGKSFVQEHVITPLFGGRSADPTKYLLGKTTFNAEMGGAEHLAMQELPSGLDFKSRVLLADELKRLIATESHALHPKYCDALTLFPWWRVSLSINNNVDRLKALPALTSDFGDKILLLLCESHPMPMPTGTPEERRAFRDVIAAELPAFMAFLLSWEIPAELRQTKHASRFGHDHFHHPRLTAALFEQEPQSSLLYILDNCEALYNMTDRVFKEAGGQGSGEEDAWGWASSELLREHLCDDGTFGRFAAQARKIFSFSGACGTYLSKLEEKFPERFRSRHTNKGNVWLLRKPKS